MDNIGKQIITKQNEEIHIDELIAQNRIYTRAKLLLYMQVIISVIVPILIGLCKIFISGKEIINLWIFPAYTVLATISVIILSVLIKHYKKIAVSIQEQFDISVLNINRNKTLNLDIPSREVIRRFSKKKNNIDKFYNWYSLNISKIKTNIAKILCQRTNITYDFSVRERYNLILLFLVILTFVSLFIIALVINLTFIIFITQVILPLLPVITLSINEYNKNKESIDNLNKLKILIEQELNNLTFEDSIDSSFLRDIQNRICANRMLSPLMPNWLYNKLRPRLEDEMNYSIDAKINELKNE